ncbi:hypothetical protein GUJ93_ZPchr0013g35576 [Zizania palustris]|uniref:RIN4 pathogenic type III effector avirulence factor Avr cleavage site domain-containing protein n=1 Tax=Zizania palustris TaxID=103762 RepID=A0A8J5WVV0_ZIZPA|nr:hypothetical protein GUJ93_ZPchr0013g35576 [Zizania palustris]
MVITRNLKMMIMPATRNAIYCWELASQCFLLVEIDRRLQFVSLLKTSWAWAWMFFSSLRLHITAAEDLKRGEFATQHQQRHKRTATQEEGRDQSSGCACAREIIHGEYQGGNKSSFACFPETFPTLASSYVQLIHGQGAASGGNGWVTVPAFGNWDMKNGALPDYSMDFSKIREMRKQNKKDLSRTSLGGDDDDLLAQQQQKAAQVKDQAKLGPPPNDHHRQLHGRDGSPTGRKTFLSYFQCCIKA